MNRRFCLLSLPATLVFSSGLAAAVQIIQIDGDAGGKQFDGIGLVNGGGATAVLLKKANEEKLSTPYFDDLVIKTVGAATPPPAAPASNRLPIYPNTLYRK